MSAFSCKLYNVVTGKEPRLWNCPKSSCHGAFLDTTNPFEPSHVKNSPFLGGTRGIVLLSSWVWKDVNGWALEIGISCTYSNPVVTGGRKHTHTLYESNMGTGGLLDRQVKELFVNHGQAVVFSSSFHHAGGSNHTIKQTGYVYRIFVCIVLAESDYPSEVGTRVKH
jgi:hypothetical protein